LSRSGFAQLLAEGVIRILGPSKPHLSNLKLSLCAFLAVAAKRRVQCREGSYVVIMLVADYQHVHAPAGIVLEICNHLAHALVDVFRPRDHAAIDQHPPSTAVLLS